MRYPTLYIACALLALTSLLGARATRAADDPLTGALPTPNPDAIFLRAASVTRSLPQPSFAVYDLTATENGLTLEKDRHADGSVTSSFYWTKISDKKRFHVNYRVSDDMSVMTNIDTGQQAFGAPIPVSVVPATGLSPFSKIPKSAGPADASSPSPSPSPALASGNVAEKVMGEISVEASRQYKVTFGGFGVENGVTTFHLLLRARTDPAMHPLTDIYVDTVTYRIVRAVAAYAASVVIDGYKCTASIDFASAGPYWIVTGGEIEGSAHFFFQHVSGAYTFTVENPTFPTTMPDSDFVAKIAS
jgi:hypothetical protein